MPKLHHTVGESVNGIVLYCMSRDKGETPCGVKITLPCLRAYFNCIWTGRVGDYSVFFEASEADLQYNPPWVYCSLVYICMNLSDSYSLCSGLHLNNQKPAAHNGKRKSS